MQVGARVAGCHSPVVRVGARASAGAGRGPGSGLPFAGGPGRGPRISRPVASGPGRGYSDYAREGHAIIIKTHHLLFQTSNSLFFENRPLAAAASQHGGKGGLEGRILSARI